MRTSFQISRECAACGRPADDQLRLIDRIDEFELSYQLCGRCTEARRGKSGLDLLPIDGSQSCFFCGAAARRVSHNNAEVFRQARHCRLHYTCSRCTTDEQAAFQRRRRRIRDDYPESSTFPVQFITDMDAEVRAIAGSSSGSSPVA